MGDYAERFEEYVSLIAQALGHADRVEPFRGYCRGLLLPTGRKSVEPMAAWLAPTRVRSEHQRLHHFVADAPWSDQAVLDVVRAHTLDRIVPGVGPPEALLIGDCGFSKKGKHSVGVTRQYCAQLRKQDNCQVAVTVSLANERFSLPVGYQLYLPQCWADDPARRAQCKVPDAIEFASKPAIALQLLERVRGCDSTPELVVADEDFGASPPFREQLTAMGFRYVLRVDETVELCPDGELLQAKALARQLPSQRFVNVAWRAGTSRVLSSRFVATRVRCASREALESGVTEEQWLLVEWPDTAGEPNKYFLSTLPADTPLKELVRLAKLGWRIERDCQEIKQEIGLGHFEGRSWRGFHHHATLCIAVYGFVVAERIAAQNNTPARLQPGEMTALPEGFRPRGAPG
jgi:SRSO17 transposase